MGIQVPPNHYWDFSDVNRHKPVLKKKSIKKVSHKRLQESRY